MATSRELLEKLYKEYDLYYDKEDPESRNNDIYVHKHYTIITRQGIQKIERRANIHVDIHPISSGPDWCVLLGTGTRQIGDKFESVSTMSSANTATCKNGYFAEIAEKRLRSRLVLTLCGLYELGVYGKDEMDDFGDAPRPPRVEKKTLFKS